MQPIWDREREGYMYLMAFILQMYMKEGPPKPGHSIKADPRRIHQRITPKLPPPSSAIVMKGDISSVNVQNVKDDW